MSLFLTFLKLASCTLCIIVDGRYFARSVALLPFFFFSFGAKQSFRLQQQAEQWCPMTSLV